MYNIENWFLQKVFVQVLKTCHLKEYQIVLSGVFLSVECLTVDGFKTLTKTRFINALDLRFYEMGVMSTEFLGGNVPLGVVDINIDCGLVFRE